MYLRLAKSNIGNVSIHTAAIKSRAIDGEYFFGSISLRDNTRSDQYNVFSILGSQQPNAEAEGVSGTNPGKTMFTPELCKSPVPFAQDVWAAAAAPVQ